MQMFSETNQSKQYVVVKRQPLNSECGLVTILFEVDENNNFVIPNDLITLQERLVWISSGYSVVDDQYRDGQAMLLEKIFEQDKTTEKYQALQEKNRADYWATGKYIKAIPDSQIIPVIRAELPDQASGRFRTEDPIPPGPMFIQHDIHVYGPFHAVRDEDGTYRAEPHQQMILKLNNDHVAKFLIKDLELNGAILKTQESNEQPYSAYVTDLRILQKQRGYEQVDYISDAQLVPYFVKHGFGLTKSLLSKKNAEALKSAISEQAKKSKLLEDPRANRLAKILDKYLTVKDPGEQIIHEWLATSDGKSFVTEHLKNGSINIGPSPAITEKKQELEEIQQQVNEYREKRELERRTYESAKTKLQSELEQERIRLESEQQKRLKENEKNLTEQLSIDIQKLIEKKSNFEKEIEELQSENKLRIEARHLHEEIKLLKREEDDLRFVVRNQQNILRNPQLPEDVSKLHWHLELLNGHIGSNNHKEIAYTPSKLMSSQPENPKMLISAIATWFESEGRAFTYEEMANLLITTQQSLMTVMKGRPGSGKTSSSIRLAQALHITDSASRGDDFLNVPVSRGWVSGRDFLGYYNPLKGSYQPARTGVYQFLWNGTSNGANNTLRIILLDEANLSPIEHYLSDFIGMFDPEGRNRPLDTGSTGEDRYIKLPDNIRFIATINSDGTTEPLSPRMCDRVPVISMDYEQPDGEDILSDLTMDGAISYDILEKFFGIKAAGDTSHSDLTIKLRKFMHKMADPSIGRPIPISQRKHNAIACYFKVAKDFVGETRAADFAISQYLLPLINGSGKAFGSRLKELCALATENGFERTRHLLNEMIEIGEENIDNYSFF